MGEHAQHFPLRIVMYPSYMHALTCDRALVCSFPARTGASGCYARTPVAQTASPTRSFLRTTTGPFSCARCEATGDSGELLGGSVKSSRKSPLPQPYWEES